MSNPDETEDDARARHEADDEADYHRYVAEAATHPPTSECPIDECSVCGFRDCPAQNDAHCYKDGCPDCHGPKAELDRSLDDIWGPT
jgi:cytochrome c1